MLIRYIISILIAFVLYIDANANSSNAAHKIDYVSTLDDLIINQKKSSSLLDTKLTIDKLIDDDMDMVATRTKIETMVKDLNSMASASMTGYEKLTALRTYIYEAGEWNNEKSFAYDLEDPEGQSRYSRLIHNYLKTGKGNCVSMPILHAILGQEIGLDMTISAAPLHLFVKYTDEAGMTINIEATSGGHPARDVWYQKNLPMLPEAIKNGMFMSKLTPEQSVAVIGHDLARHLVDKGDYENAILVSERLIIAFPNYAPLHMNRGSAYFKLIERDFQSKYPDPNDIPKELHTTFKTYMTQNRISFQKADALGWAHPDELLKIEKLRGTK